METNVLQNNGEGNTLALRVLLIADRKIKSVMTRDFFFSLPLLFFFFFFGSPKTCTLHQICLCFLLEPCLFHLMAGTYPPSRAPCRWFSNRKCHIRKHKPTIYTANKQRHVNLNALTPWNPPTSDAFATSIIKLIFFLWRKLHISRAGYKWIPVPDRS